MRAEYENKLKIKLACFLLFFWHFSSCRFKGRSLQVRTSRQLATRTPVWFGAAMRAMSWVRPFLELVWRRFALEDLGSVLEDCVNPSGNCVWFLEELQASSGSMTFVLSKTCSHTTCCLWGWPPPPRMHLEASATMNFQYPNCYLLGKSFLQTWCWDIPCVHCLSRAFCQKSKQTSSSCTLTRLGSLVWDDTVALWLRRVERGSYLTKLCHFLPP